MKFSKKKNLLRIKSKKNKKKRAKLDLMKYFINKKGGGRFEEDVYEQLFRSRFDFTNKRCLDIGTRNGLNCIKLVQLGAKSVIGIDIDDSRFDEMFPNENIDLIKINLLDFHDEEKFDVITCFLWNMKIPQYQKIINKIKSLLKPDGTIFIGFHDDLYKFGYVDDKNIMQPNTGSVPELIHNNFENYIILDKNNRFQWIIKASYYY